MRLVDDNSNREINLDHLRARVRVKPRTKAGQIRQAWPEIRDLILAGHSLKDIWTWLNESGVSIGYARLSHYIGQLRKQEGLGSSHARRGDGPSMGFLQGAVAPSLAREGDNAAALVPTPAHDPLVNVRERLGKRPGFNYNSEADLKKLI
jgi:hypothetical protein